jgi:formate hydrogenlyase transcriptional activator
MRTTDAKPVSARIRHSSDIDFGIGEQRVPRSAHVAYFWETEKEFAEAIRFLETGLRGSDYCVVFGHDEVNKAVCQVLEERGFNVKVLQDEGRIAIVGGSSSAEKILQTIGGAFSEAQTRGAPLIRLLGNIGWGKSNWPEDHDLLAFEAKVTDAAKQFPCVVVCMYNTLSLAGHVLHHGGFGTHPYLMSGPSQLRENPHYIPTQLFLQRLETLAAEIAERKKRDDALKRSEERFRSLFENSIDAVLLARPDGTVEAANPEACRLFGRSEEEICAIGRFGLVDPADGRLESLLEERERTGRFRGELLYKRKDGSTFLGEVSSAFYQDVSGAKKAAVIIRDVTERNRVEEILRHLTEGTAGVTGGDFFRSLARHLAESLQVRYVFITECTDASKTRVRTLASWAGENFGVEMTFPLYGTPCEKVIAGDVCYFPEGLQALFPEDKDLVTLKAESYLGVPLYGSAGDILGHLVVMDDKPMADMQHNAPILRIFAARAGAELERARAHKELESLNAELGVLLDINRAIGRHLKRDELFGALAGCLKTLVATERFGIEFPIEGDKLQGHILSNIPTGEEQTQPTVLPALGTACHWVIQNRAQFVAACRDEIRERFPVTFDVMSSQGMESLCALPLVSGDRSQGELFFMATSTGAYDHLRREFLEQVANQIAIAVKNMKAYEEVETLNARIAATAQHRQTLLDINNAVVTKLTRDELLAAVCEALGRVLSFDRLALSLYDPQLDSLRIVAYAGPYQREDYTPIGRVLDLKDSPVGWAFLDQKPVVRRDLETERQTSSEERAYGHGFRSLCALPLVIRGKSIGAITVGSRTSCQYSEADALSLMEVANQIAIAIDNMQSHEETAALKARFQAEAIYLQEEIKAEHNFEEIIGQSAPVRQLLRKVEQVAPTEATVLIQGETGTGKELLARAVHDRSRRKDRPLVKVNCGSIPAGLVESELFGHEKGAFTGATQRRIGRFELANGGTIFLDEVTELPIDTQVKLLRVLQEGEFERVGSSQTFKVDVRVIAATNRDLKEMVGNGTFRSDLFYRLNVFPVEVPSLRDRKQDIPLLVNFFLSKFGKKLGKEIRGVSQRTMEGLINYSWPGNVRELQNVIERSVVLAGGPIVQIDEPMMRSGEAVQESTLDTLENAERNHILRALKETHWVIHGKKGAAEILGINPSTLRSRMEKLGIKKTQAA